MSSAPFVSVADVGPARTVTMSNPGRRNAVPPHGWAELTAVFEAFEASDRRVLVLRGDGDDFCAGADLVDSLNTEMPSAADNLRAMDLAGRMALSLARLSKPTVAAVDGVAVGAGLNLAIGCDVAIATTRSRFAEIFVLRGLALDAGGTWLLPRLIGLAKARDLALTGRVIDAEEAAAMGLVAAIVDVDDLDAAVRERVDALAAGAPLAQRFIKVGLNRSSTMTLEQAIAFENQAQAVLMASEDAREGTQSFLDKREPRFRGR